MNDCTKCGHRPRLRRNYCNICRWLLRLEGAIKPINWDELGLPQGNDFTLRQATEAIPFGRRVEFWPEVF